MKRNTKRHLCCCMAGLVCLTAGHISAQEAEDTVILPEVTTVISGETLTVDPQAIPDFSAALPAKAAETGALPVLPAVPSAPVQADTDMLQPQDKEKIRSVYIDGLAGAGLPAFFTGDFSIYRMDTSNPFKIRFVYESMDGYAFNTFGDGFSDSLTVLEGNKTFTAGSAVWDLSGSYRISSAGLQGQSDLFSDFTRQIAEAGVSFSVPFAKNFGFKAAVQGEWFNRYGGTAGSGIVTSEKTAASFISAVPEFSVYWANDIARADISGNWNFALYAGSGVRPVNRGELTLSGRWNFSALSIWVNAGLVGIIGGSGADNTALIVPVTAGLHGEFNVPFSELPVSAEVQGGLGSKAVDFASLDQADRFTVFAPELLSANREQSDWFASLTAAVPVGTVFSIEGAAEFRKTAFGNGVVESMYDDARYPNSGLFRASVIDRTGLETSLKLSAGLGSFLLAAVWNAEWLDIPAGKDAHTVECSAAYTSVSGKWFAGISAAEAVSSGADFVPDVGIQASYQVTDAVRLVFEVTDAVKLCTGRTRIYESPFITRSGKASFSVRFFF